jgi:hypothetical protein
VSGGIVDLHIHAAPSVLPRRHADPELDAVLGAAGVELAVLKSHEGSTAERAALLGDRVLGGVVLNSPVGGASPDAVAVAAALGGRIVWMPTVSARTHQRGAESAELNVHAGLAFRAVDLLDADGALLAEWFDVIDVVAEHDMVLASGHLSMDESCSLFEHARARGVRRLLVNHPALPFLGWRDDHAERFRALDARLEVGVVADRLSDGRVDTWRLAELYPTELLVHGSDLGHRDFPPYGDALESWIATANDRLGADATRAILTTNSRSLIAA